MAEILDVNDGNFEQEVIHSQTTVLIDFWAPWCGPCRMVGPIVEELAKEYTGRLKVAKVNVDENQQVAGLYGIRGIPTLVFFKDGQEVKRIVGAQGKALLQNTIDEVIG